MSIGRKEAVAVTAGVVLVVAAFVVPHLHLGNVTPLIKMTPQQIRDFAATQGVDPETAREQGMAERSEAFRASGGALYRKV